MTTRISMKNLEQRRLFVLAYIDTWSATKAAERLGCNPASSKTIGPRMLANVGVQAELARAVQKRLARLTWDADRALYLRRCIADATLTDFAEVLRSDDPYQALKALPEELRHALGAIEVTYSVETVTEDGKTETRTKHRRTRLKLQDKQHAIDMLEEARARAGAPPLPAIELGDLDAEEAAEVMAVCDLIIRKREEKQRRLLEQGPTVEGGE